MWFLVLCIFARIFWGAHKMLVKQPPGSCAVSVGYETWPVIGRCHHCHRLCNWLVLGWGLLSQFPPFHYFPNCSSLSKHTLAVKYCVYIWQVSPQLSCGDTCQIWMWFEKSNMHFCKIENFAYGEINERSFSNPHPWAHFLSFAQSKLRLCSANHRAGYFSNLACDWLSIVWVYSEQVTEKGPRYRLENTYRSSAFCINCNALLAHVTSDNCYCFPEAMDSPSHSCKARIGHKIYDTVTYLVPAEREFTTNCPVY